MTCDRFHLPQEFLYFNAKANANYDPNDKRGYCHQVCHKLYYTKKQLCMGKSLVLFQCQLHIKQYITLKSIYVLK